LEIVDVTAKLTDLNIDHILNLYDSGMTGNEIADLLGVGDNTIYRRLREAGATLRDRRIPLDDAAIVEAYEAGGSVKALAEKQGVSRNVIARVLGEHGITPRGRSEAMYVRMRDTPPEERARLAGAAHAAASGSRRSYENLCNRALTIEKKGRAGSRIEARAAGMLRQAGFDCTQQKAVGKYNVDVATTEPPIAVEIFGGQWHAHGRHAARFRERTEYILNAGWTLVIIWVTRDYPLEPGAIDYVVALAERLRSGESVGSQEHVIRGDGESTTIGYSNLYDGAFVSGTQPRDDVTGRFTNRIRE